MDWVDEGDGSSAFSSDATQSDDDCDDESIGVPSDVKVLERQSRRRFSAASCLVDDDVSSDGGDAEAKAGESPL